MTPPTIELQSTAFPAFNFEPGSDYPPTLLDPQTGLVSPLQLPIPPLLQLPATTQPVDLPALRDFVAP
jgi:hypothetical protein